MNANYQTNGYQWGTTPLAPSGAPTLDQVGQVIDFLDRLGSRQSQTNQSGQQAGSTLPLPSSGLTAASFQSIPVEQLRQQEQQFAHLQSSTQSSTQQSKKEAELMEKLQVMQAGFQALLQYSQAQEQVINQLVPFVQVNQLLNQEIGALDNLVNSLLPFVQVNQMLNQEIDQMDVLIDSLLPFVEVANIWQQDSLAHEQVLDNLCFFMTDPDALLPWSFGIWENTVNVNSEPAIRFVGDRYLELIEKYEQAYQSANNGQHSPMWMRANSLTGATRQLQTQTLTSGNPIQIMPQPQQQMPNGQFQQPPQAYQYQQQQYQAPPMPPIPGSQGPTVDPLIERIQMYKSGDPNLGRKLQQLHLAQRRGFNGGGY